MGVQNPIPRVVGTSVLETKSRSLKMMIFPRINKNNTKIESYWAGNLSQENLTEN